MSTFPRRVKQPGSAGPAQPLLTRPTSDSKFLDFDAGINSSAAWTEHLDLRSGGSVHDVDDDDLSLSDAGTEKQDDKEGEHGTSDEDTPVEVTLTRGRPARILYDFNGENKAQELCVRAGDEVEILQETIEGAEGWSLARIPLQIGDEEQEQWRRQDDVHNEDELDGDSDSERGGQVGLVPRDYYAFTTDFVSSPADEDGLGHERDASTPRASASTNPPLVPQNTGEWFRQQLRRSLLGGRSFNRFSRFVTSGAETFILHGAPSPATKSTSTPAPSSSSNPDAKEGTDGLPQALDFRLSTYLGASNGHSREPSVLPPEAGPDTHFIDVDEAGPTWRSKVPPFDVRVHSPEKRSPTGPSDVNSYIVYSITSTFSSPSPIVGELNSQEEDPEDIPSDTAHMITVHRRFSHFVLLHTALSAQLPGLALPPLPEKQYAGRLSTAFVEARRGALQRYLCGLVKHPVVRYAEPLTFFLSCEDEVEWRRQLPYHFHRQPAGASFFANVFHLPFQVDTEDAAETGERFENHTHAVARGVQQLRGTFNKIRGARLEMSNAERQLSYSILSLITSTPLSGSSSVDSDDENESDDEESDRSLSQSSLSPNGHSRRSCKRKKGLQNADGAWCWREDCADCLRLTKCMQKTAETLQGVADLFDNHARRTMLDTEDSLKDAAHPDTIYTPILGIHKETLKRYKEKEKESTDPQQHTSKTNDNNDNDNDNIAARCETVLNTSLAEFDQYHSQKHTDFERVTKMHLDSEIAFYSKILSRLHTTRALFNTNPAELELTFPGARTPSLYERELRAAAPARLVAEPLSPPTPHVLDSYSYSYSFGPGPGPSSSSMMMMRPVSAAIQGLLGISGANGVGVGGGVGVGVHGVHGDAEERGSVFSRLW